MNRRGRGEGSVRQLDDGRWQGRLSYVDAAGKRCRPVFYGASKREVLDAMRRRPVTDEARAGTATRLTVAIYLEQWVAGKKGHVEPCTWDSYESQVRVHLSPYFERTLLAKLTAARVERMYVDLADAGLSPSLLRRLGTTLGTAMRHAVYPLRLLPANPVGVVRKPRVHRREMTALTVSQLASFFAAVKADRLAAFWSVWVASCARGGELLALTWADVDLAGASISINKALEDLRGKLRIKVTKTRKSRRLITLPAFAVAALVAHRDRMQVEGHYAADKPVFCDTDGGHLSRSNLRQRSFLPAVKQANNAGAKLPPFRPYDLRHTGASLLLLAGESPKVVSERLGHATTALTMDTYSHVMPGMQEQAAAKLQHLLGEIGHQSATNSGTPTSVGVPQVVVGGDDTTIPRSGFEPEIPV